MCGRTACTLDPSGLCRACGYRDNNGKRLDAKWVNGPPLTYRPSYNFSPDQFGPVVVSATHFTDVLFASSSDRVLHPMRWGLMPSWYKGDPVNFKYKMINARVEGIVEKASYRNALEKGRRCVVVADGFYEWQKTVSGPKQPYFIRFPQSASIDFTKPEPKLENEKEDDEWDGRRLLTMAGLFDISMCDAVPAEPIPVPLYSYAVITVPASAHISSIHDRMPAILDGDDAVADWLDSKRVPLKQALTLLKPMENLDIYPVSTLVNNVAHRGPECIAPLRHKDGSERSAEKSKVQSTLMEYWKPKSEK